MVADSELIQLLIWGHEKRAKRPREMRENRRYVSCTYNYDESVMQDYENVNEVVESKT